LFIARADQVETILVFGVQHDGFRMGLEGDRVAYPYDETVTLGIRKLYRLRGEGACSRWAGLALQREAALKSCGRYATEREQAPSPQKHPILRGIVTGRKKPRKATGFR
jgi:hypothetical protein